MPPRESDEVIAMRPADFDGFVFAAGKYAGAFGPKLEQMPRPGQLQMAARPTLREPVPLGGLQLA